MNEESKAIIVKELADDETMIFNDRLPFLRSVQEELRIAGEELRSNTVKLLNIGYVEVDQATISTQAATDEINWLIRIINSL